MLTTTSTERMRKSRQQHEVESSIMANESGVASTSRASQTKNIDTDSEQSTSSQDETDDRAANTNQHRSQMQKQASVSNGYM